MKTIKDYIEEKCDGKFSGIRSQFLEKVLTECPPKGFWMMPTGDWVYSHHVPNWFQRLVAKKVLGMVWSEVWH